MKTIIYKWYSKTSGKLISIQEEPWKVCYGFALGIFLATTPFIGLKVFIGMLFSRIMRWNRTACLIGIFHVNGLTAPAFYALSFFIGNALFGYDLVFSGSDLKMSMMIRLLFVDGRLFFALLAGGLILSIPLCTGAFLLSRYLLKKSLKPCIS